MNFLSGIQFGNEGPAIGKYKVTLNCYCVAMYPIDKSTTSYENGGKIIMPPSVLDALSRMNIEYPMLFKLTNYKNKMKTHCGVIEFSAPEGTSYIPHWMMQMLGLAEGDMVELEYVTLKPCEYAKFQPVTLEFLEITNQKAVLENELRNFACLTKGDLIAVSYINKIYQLSVLELKPADAVNIIECDMSVDFEAPEGYVPPKVHPKKRLESMETEEKDPALEAAAQEMEGFFAFKGTGQRLDGKVKDNAAVNRKSGARRRGIPNYDYKPNKLTFVSAKKLAKEQAAKMSQTHIDEDIVFKGASNVLKQKRQNI